ncbi:MAG: LysR family transcriptional regulator [Myxococcota bacterium]
MMPITSGFDPGSLLVLHALLEERHVTRAAKRLGLAQSSLSHRLARLRAQLDDPLFVRVKNELVPTPRALALAGPLRTALEALEQLARAPRPFDPASSNRAFVLGMPDLLAPVVTPVLATLTRSAPGVGLRVTGLPAALGDGLAAGEPELALAPLRDVPPEARARPLGEVHFGVVVRRGHPLLRGPLTTERWLRFGHVVVRSGSPRPNQVAEALERQGLSRRVGLEVPTFLAGLVAVSSSDLVMNAPLASVHALSRALGLVVRPPPVRLPAIAAALVWHERFHHDEGHRWARELVFASVTHGLARARPAD